MNSKIRNKTKETSVLFFQDPFSVIRPKLIPGWLSVLGLLRAILYLASGLLGMIDVDFGILEAPPAL